MTVHIHDRPAVVNPGQELSPWAPPSGALTADTLELSPVPPIIPGSPEQWERGFVPTDAEPPRAEALGGEIALDGTRVVPLGATRRTSPWFEQTTRLMAPVARTAITPESENTYQQRRDLATLHGPVVFEGGVLSVPGFPEVVREVAATAIFEAVQGIGIATPGSFEPGLEIPVIVAEADTVRLPEQAPGNAVALAAWQPPGKTPKAHLNFYSLGGDGRLTRTGEQLPVRPTEPGAASAAEYTTAPGIGKDAYDAGMAGLKAERERLLTAKAATYDPVTIIQIDYALAAVEREIGEATTIAVMDNLTGQDTQAGGDSFADKVARVAGEPPESSGITDPKKWREIVVVDALLRVRAGLAAL